MADRSTASASHLVQRRRNGRSGGPSRARCRICQLRQVQRVHLSESKARADRNREGTVLGRRIASDQPSERKARSNAVQTHRTNARSCYAKGEREDDGQVPIRKHGRPDASKGPSQVPVLTVSQASTTSMLATDAASRARSSSASPWPTTGTPPPRYRGEGHTTSQHRIEQPRVQAGRGRERRLS